MDLFGFYHFKTLSCTNLMFITPCHEHIILHTALFSWCTSSEWSIEHIYSYIFNTEIYGIIYHRIESYKLHISISVLLQHSILFLYFVSDLFVNTFWFVDIRASASSPDNLGSDFKNFYKVSSPAKKKASAFHPILPL